MATGIALHTAFALRRQLEHASRRLTIDADAGVPLAAR